MTDKELLHHLLESPDLEKLQTLYQEHSDIFMSPLTCTMRLTVLQNALSGRKRWEEYRNVIKWLINHGIWEDKDKQVCEYGYPPKACSLFYTKLHVDKVKDALDIL